MWPSQLLKQQRNEHVNHTFYIDVTLTTNHIFTQCVCVCVIAIKQIQNVKITEKNLGVQCEKCFQKL